MPPTPPHPRPVFTHTGLERYGHVKTPGGQVVYAYEVDGRGGSLIDFDDPNLPSLVSRAVARWI